MLLSQKENTKIRVVRTVKTPNYWSDEDKKQKKLKKADNDKFVVNYQKMLSTMRTTKQSLLFVRENMIPFYEKHSEELFRNNKSLEDNNKKFLERKQIMKNNSYDDDEDGYTSQLEKEMEDLRCIASNLYAHALMQDLLDNPLSSRISKRKAIQRAKADYDLLNGSDQPTSSSAAAGSVVYVEEQQNN